MARRWVRACRPISRYALDGGYRTYQPGDWFEVMNHEMRQLVERGLVDTTPTVLKEEYNFKQAGLLIRGDSERLSGLTEYGIESRKSDRIELPWPLTILWKPGTNASGRGAILGLTRLYNKPDTIAWEMVAALAHDRKLVRDIGSAEERAKTKELIGDLRLPIYQTGLLWVRKTDATEELLGAWQEEIDAGADEQHAFLRTLYTRRVLLCTLPTNWIGQWMWA